MMSSLEDPVSIPKFKILGVSISAAKMVTVTSAIKNWSSDAIGRIVCVREAASLMTSREDPMLVELHEKAEIITPDGMPLVWIGRGLGYDIERVCGPDLMYEICVTQSGMGLKHFFYGGKDGVAEKLAMSLKSKSPELIVVGTYCPPFRPLTREEDESVVRQIKDSEADIVWIGISSPRQDLWMWDHREQLSQTMIGVGAAFDFLSGQVSRAPIWMQKRGLESVYRLCSEPRRLWKRYLIQVPRFIFLLIVDRSIGALFAGWLRGEVRK
jgi:N-acetylglucosaminyldiphosphoundecaprenol N-acetyl-beta-D-mannosaminyltransferase